MLSLFLAVSIGSAFGATSVSSHQPETTSASEATSVSSHQPETVTKSMTRSGEGAVPTSGTGHRFDSTNGSFYQNVSATGLLKESIEYATEQETQM